MTAEDDAPDTVWFLTAAEHAPPGVTLHRRGDSASAAIAKRFDEVKEDWRSMVSTVIELADTTDALAPRAGLRLAELTIELGFTASGKLAFIAEAGVSGSITLTFCPSADGTAPDKA